MEILDLAQRFEKNFVEAGELACSLRKTAISSQKYNTGFSEIDIVTTADLEVQEFVLSRLAQSKLKSCELIAEEDTPGAGKFAKVSEYVLTLDPIDGTKLYANGKKMFSIVVTIHNKKRPIYTFCYYPAVKWGFKIVNDKISYIGKKPKINTVSKIPDKSVGYFDRPGKLGPQKTNPKLYQRLVKQGYHFVESSDISDETGIKAPFLLGVTAGEFIENGSAVDSLTEWHFALANNIKIYLNYDLSKPVLSPRGNYLSYKGHYIVAR